MELFIYTKGQVYAADCSKCGRTHYIHEWTTDDFNADRDAMQSGSGRCPECSGNFDPDTFADCGQMYAGRYSMPGYLDCTDWHYNEDRQALVNELQEMYGEQTTT